MSERRIEFPEKVKVKRLHFAEFKCEGIVELENGTKTRCNAALTRKRTRFDHDIPAELDGPPTFENCRALCIICDKAKYPSDRANIDQAKRREIADLGVKSPSRPIQSAGFRQREKEPRAPVRVAEGRSNFARRFPGAFE